MRFPEARGDLKTASAAELRGVMDVNVNGLIAATQAALPDLKQHGRRRAG